MGTELAKGILKFLMKMIKQEAALASQHSNLSQSKLMLEHKRITDIKSGIILC